MAKSVGNIFLLHVALAAYGRDALIVYFCRGPLPPADRFRRRSPRRRRRRASSASARQRAGWCPAPSPAWSRAAAGPLLRRLADDFNTPRALAAAFDWVREANRSAERVGDADLREMLGVLALDNLLDVRAGRRPGGDGAARAPRRPPGRSVTGPRPTAARRAAGARLGDPRRRRTGRSCCRYGDRLRAQRGTRGAPGSAHGEPDLGDARTRCASRGWRPAGVAVVEDAPRRSSGAAARRPSGRVRRRVASSSTPTPTRCSAAAASRCSSRWTRFRTRRTSARSAARPSAPGRLGWCLPERRAAEVTPAVCKASAGAVEHLPIAQVRNLADFLGDAKARGFWCYGADAGGSASTTARSTSAARWCSCSALRDAACGPGWRRRATR